MKTAVLICKLQKVHVLEYSKSSTFLGGNNESEGVMRSLSRAEFNFPLFGVQIG